MPGAVHSNWDRSVLLAVVHSLGATVSIVSRKTPSHPSPRPLVVVRTSASPATPSPPSMVMPFTTSNHIGSPAFTKYPPKLALRSGMPSALPLRARELSSR